MTILCTRLGLLLLALFFLIYVLGPEGPVPVTNPSEPLTPAAGESIRVPSNATSAPS